VPAPENDRAVCAALPIDRLGEIVRRTESGTTAFEGRLDALLRDRAQLTLSDFVFAHSASMFRRPRSQTQFATAYFVDCFLMHLSSED